MQLAAHDVAAAAADHFASSATFRLASANNLYPFIDISMPAMLSVSRVQSAVLQRPTIRRVWTADQEI